MTRRRTRSGTDVTVTRVQSGGVYVRVSTVGTEGTRPFVLVPGIGVSSNYFERLAPYLNEYGPVHAVDLPGFGGVPHPEEKATIRQYADLVGEVIDALGLEDPIVVGHSMGTQVVVDLVARRPEISTVVLIGPVVCAYERSIPRQARRFLSCAVREPGRIKVLALSSYAVCGVKWFSRVLPEMMQYRIEDQLPRVQASTLVIRGERDAVCPAPWADTVADLLPRARAFEIPGAAHSVMFAHAAEVARLCVDHARHPAAPNAEVRLQQLDETDGEAEPQGSRATPGEFLHTTKGRLKEWRGILTEDDALMAEGKTLQAEAMEGRVGLPDAPPD